MRDITVLSAGAQVGSAAMNDEIIMMELICNGVSSRGCVSPGGWGYTMWRDEHRRDRMPFSKSTEQDIVLPANLFYCHSHHGK